MAVTPTYDWPLRPFWWDQPWAIKGPCWHISGVYCDNCRPHWLPRTPTYTTTGTTSVFTDNKQDGTPQQFPVQDFVPPKE